MYINILLNSTNNHKWFLELSETLTVSCTNTSHYRAGTSSTRHDAFSDDRDTWKARSNYQYAPWCWNIDLHVGHLWGRLGKIFIPGRNIWELSIRIQSHLLIDSDDHSIHLKTGMTNNNSIIINNLWFFYHLMGSSLRSTWWPITVRLWPSVDQPHLSILSSYLDFLPPGPVISGTFYRFYPLLFVGKIYSMGWLKGKSTGNHRFSHEIWDFPANFPLNQPLDI